MVTNLESNKRIVKNTFFLYIRLLVSMLIGLFTSRAVLDALGIEDYGLYNLVGGFVILLNIFTISLTGTATRFITYGLGENDTEKLKSVFSTISSLMMVVAGSIFILGIIIGYFFINSVLNIPVEKITTAQIVYVCSLFVFSANILAVPFVSVVTAHERMDFYAIMSIYESVVKLSIAYSLYLIANERLTCYAVFLALLSISIRLIYGLYAKKHFEEASFCMRIDRKVLKNIFSFSFWLSFGSATGILKDYGGNVVLNVFYGLTGNAANGVASMVKNIISSFTNSIGTAIAPQITKAYAQKDYQRSISLTFVMAKFQASCSLFVIIPLIINTPFLLSLWLKNVPVSAISFTRLMCVICFVICISNSYGTLYMAIGNIKKLQKIISLINIFYIPCCFFGYKVGGPPETYLYLLLVFETFLFIICYIHLNSLLSISLRRIFVDIFIRAMLILVFTIIISKYVSEWIFNNPIIIFFCSTMMSEFIAITFVYTFLFENKERKYILDIVYKKLR